MRAGDGLATAPMAGNVPGADDDAQDTEALYQRIVLDRARSPHHAGRLECADAEAAGDNPMCGDRISLQLRRDAAGRIEAIAFEARGCAISLASADLMADAVHGLDRAAVDRLAASFRAMVTAGDPPAPDLGALQALAGVHAYRARIRCATLAWSALERALGSTQDVAGAQRQEA